jgi:hypothetical protein
MNKEFIIEDNFLTDDEKNIIDEHIVKSSNIAFYKNFATSEKFPHLTHSLLLRNSSEPCSVYFSFFLDIFSRFVKKNNIPVKYILRATINLTFENSKYKFTDLHVDQDAPHKVFILYLNDLEEIDLSSTTIIFDKTYDEIKKVYVYLDEKNTVENVLETWSIKHKVSAKNGRVICFDGKYYHTGCFPRSGEFRYIVVFNFS